MRELLQKLSRKVEEVSFTKIFLFWLSLMAVIGFAYFALSFSPQNALVHQGDRIEPDINGLLTAEFFSFVTSVPTSLGNSGIIPMGFSRV